MKHRVMDFGIKRSLLILLYLVLNVGLLHAQNEKKRLSEITNLEKVIAVNKAFSPVKVRNLNYTVYQNKLMFCCFSTNDNTDSIWVYKLDLSNFKLDSTVFFIENLSNHLIKNYNSGIDFIAFSNKWTVIGFYGSMCIYDKNDSLIRKFEIDDRIKYAKFIDENTLFYGWNYNTTRKNVKKTAFKFFDIEQGKVFKSIYPDFKFIQYSHFSPNHWIDAGEKSILFAQSIDYQVDFYDFNLERTDSIRFEPADWKRIPEKERNRIAKKKLSGVDAIYAILPYENITSRLKQVFFMSDSIILAQYSKANRDSTDAKTKLGFDVWKKQGGVWKKTHDNLVDEYEDSEVITSENYPLFEGKLSESIIFADNYLIALMPYAPINPIGLSKKAYKEQCDEYLLDNSPQLVLFIYSLKL